jgi:Ca2+-binding EF-hand superfamily protein
MGEHFFKEFNQKEIEAAFDYFDTDKSGYISEDELFSAMSKFRNTITKNEIQKLIQFIDKDNDGRINKKGKINNLCNLIIIFNSIFLINYRIY